MYLLGVISMVDKKGGAPEFGVARNVDDKVSTPRACFLSKGLRHSEDDCHQRQMLDEELLVGFDVWWPIGIGSGAAWLF